MATLIENIADEIQKSSRKLESDPPICDIWNQPELMIARFRFSGKIEHLELQQRETSPILQLLASVDIRKLEDSSVKLFERFLLNIHNFKKFGFEN